MSTIDIQHKHLDAYINAMCKIWSSTVAVQRVSDYIDQYDEAVQKYDPEGISESESDELVDKIIADMEDAPDLTENVKKAALAYLDSLDDATREKLMEHTVLDWVDAEDDDTKSFRTLLMDTVIKECASIMPQWMEKKEVR